jgi:hypothetical protein
MNAISTGIRLALAAIKADPKVILKATDIVAKAIGYVSIAIVVLQKALEVLQQVLIGLGAS